MHQLGFTRMFAHVTSPLTLKSDQTRPPQPWWRIQMCNFFNVHDVQKCSVPANKLFLFLTNRKIWIDFETEKKTKQKNNSCYIT